MTKPIKLFVFVPIYNKPNKEFIDSLNKSTIPFRLIFIDRKVKKCYWTKALNDYIQLVKNFPKLTDEVICVMNSDITFNADLFEEGIKVKEGEVVFIDQF